MWKWLRSFLFCFDAERSHRFAIAALAAWSRTFPPHIFEKEPTAYPVLRRTLFGIDFPNPLGLAAGFDKDAEAVPALQALGFGFIEVGTVTARPQPGNPRPRLFRLPADEALMNRLGFNNQGAKALARRLENYRRRGSIHVPIGVNIGKSQAVPNEAAAKDYLESFSTVADVADYIVINVSSPNTPGLRELEREEELKKILDAVIAENERRIQKRPIFVKLSPDLSDAGAMACADVSLERQLAGLVVCNTTISRQGLIGPLPEGPGGISGRPLFVRSTGVLGLIRRHVGRRLVLIGVGGIMGPNEALQKINAGAELLQVYTGFVYGGPNFPRQILQFLTTRGERAQF